MYTVNLRRARTQSSKIKSRKVWARLIRENFSPRKFLAIRYRPGGSFDLRHRWATKPYINMFAIPVNISANNGEYITFEVPHSNTQRYTDVVARQVNNNLFPPTQKYGSEQIRSRI